MAMVTPAASVSQSDNVIDSAINILQGPLPKESTSTPKRKASNSPAAMDLEPPAKLLPNASISEGASPKPQRATFKEPPKPQRATEQPQPQLIKPKPKPIPAPPVDMGLTAAERAEMEKKETPQWGFLMLENMFSRMAKLQEAANITAVNESNAVRLELTAEVNAVEEKVNTVEVKVDDLSFGMEILKEQTRVMRERVIQNDCKTRRKNLLFSGFAEDKEEKRYDMCKLVRAQIVKIAAHNTDLPNLKNARFDAIYRNGKYKKDQKRPRDILVVFKDGEERDAILAGKKHVDSNIFINADLPPELNFAQRTLRPILKLLDGTPYGDKNRSSCIAGVLKIDDRKYNLENLMTLPKIIKFWSNNVKFSDSVYVWFGILCPFSNFFWSPIIIDRKEFLMSEQYIQWCKAELFGDDHVSKLIMAATDPYTMKRLAYQIEGFNQKTCDKEVPSVCDKVLRAKVSQHGFIKQYLIDTHPKYLAEAAPKSLWACGIALKDDDCINMSKWKRIGLGGLTLMKIRSEILGVPMPRMDMSFDDED